jgi:hypothetical protein
MGKEETQELDVLRHMLGNHKSASLTPGWRNYFCAGMSGEDHDTLLRLEKKGLVRRGPRINEGTNQYWFATPEGIELGCQTIKD